MKILVLALALLLIAAPANAQFTQCDPATVSYDDLLSRRCIIMSRQEFLREVRKIIKQLEPGLKIDARKCSRIVDDKKYVECVVKQVKDASP